MVTEFNDHQLHANRQALSIDMIDKLPNGWDLNYLKKDNPSSQALVQDASEIRRRRVGNKTSISLLI